jgi:hypothetical protein
LSNTLACLRDFARTVFLLQGFFGFLDELFFEMFCFLIVFGVLGGADLPGVLGLAKLKKVRQEY